MKSTNWLLGAAASALLAASPAMAQDKVTVGLILSLSGPGAVLGQEMKRGTDLALELLGGKLGGRDAQFIYEDDQQKPEVGVQVAGKLTRSDRANFIVGPSYSNVMMAVHAPVTRSKTFLLSPNPAPAPLAGEKCDPYYFATPFQNDQPSEAMGKYATDQGVKKIYLMAPNYQAGRDFLEGFKRNFKGEILGEVYTPLNQTDFSAELTALRAANPDAVFAAYPGGLGVQFVKQFAQAGLKGKLPVYTAFTVNGAVLPAMGEDALGVKSASHWSVSLDNPGNKRFVAAFEKKYNSVPSEFAAQAYDVIMMIDGALKKTGGKTQDADALRAALKAADFESVRGAFKFNNNHHPVEDFYLLNVQKDAQGRLVQVSEGVIAKAMADTFAKDCKM